jgi:hypothetical protein
MSLTLTRRIARRWVALPLLGSLAVFDGRFPRSFTLAVLVADGRTGALLSGAQVQIPSRKLAQRSDSAGEVRFRALTPGVVRVTALYPGYARIETEAILGLHDSTVVVFLMEAISQPLDTIRVSAPAVRDYLREFEGRRKMGLGRFLTSVQLDSTRHENVVDLIARRFTGLRAVWDFTLTEVTLESRRGVTSFKHQCHPQVYIDEKPATGDLLGWLQAGDVAGVEYYSNAPPVQYHRAGSACGVVLIWTTR